jgi:hypothetical protein
MPSKHLPNFLSIHLITQHLIHSRRLQMRLCYVAYSLIRSTPSSYQIRRPSILNLQMEVRLFLATH